MKKIKLFALLLFTSVYSYGQTYTTGTVNLSSSVGLAMSIKLDVGTNVTMTLIGPPTRWFAVGFGASGMTSGTDVVGVHTSGTLTNFDASLIGYAAPVTDAQQDWTISSDQVNAGVRTIIATRALNTGDAADYVFTAGPGSLSLIWARGNSTSFTYSNHGGSNRGISTATFSLLPSPPALSINPASTTICQGNSTTLTASSDPGATFVWSPGGANTASITVSPNTTTTYTCTATLNGQSSIATSLVTVNPNPVVNQVSSSSYCDYQYVPQTIFSGTAGATYSWTNSNTLNGIQASGTGNIPGYTATVLSNSVQTGTITVTPSLNGCAGSPMTFSISLVPTPGVYQFDWNWCHGQTATPVVWQGNYTSVQWTNSNTSIGQVASGTGVLPAFTALNTGASVIISTVTATPFYSFGGATCTSSAPPSTFQYRVYPLGTVVPNPDLNVCSGSTVNGVNFTGNTTQFEWTNSNPAIGLPAIGIGNISFTAPSVTSIATATIIVTPRFPAYNFYCDGAADTFLITIYPPLTSQTFITSCSPVVWNGNTYSSSGTYSVNLTGANGCDSIATLVLTNGSTVYGGENITACNGYSWNGATYTSTGTYTAMLTAANGCDSVATLNLTISNVLTSQTTISTCIPIVWNGNTYSSSGTYSVNLTGANGCDSIATLVLTNGATVYGGENITACNGYTWNGSTYTATGTYTAMLTAANGCDSVATLNLTISTPLSSQTTISSCIPIVWNGNTYSSSGTYSVNLTGANGCDSIATLLLTNGATVYGGESITACNSYTWNGSTYTASGSYTAMLTAASGCDSVATLTLTINSGPQTPIVNVINTADYVELSTPAQTNVTYQWVNCPNYDAIVGEDSSTFIVTANGNYAVIVTNACGSDTSNCTPITTTIGLEEYSGSFEIYPTILQSYDWITLSTDYWVLYDSFGKLLRTIAPEDTHIQLTYPAGVYMLSNAKSIHRIILY